MEKDSGRTLKELAVDGGMSNSDLCMQVRSIYLSPKLQAPTYCFLGLGLALRTPVTPN